MAKNRFAKLDTVKLGLSDGDWIEVKRELTYGDALDLRDSSTSIDPEMKVRIHEADFWVNRLLSWLVSWSLTDDNGPVEISRDSIRALRRDDAEEINVVLETYIKETGAAKN